MAVLTTPAVSAAVPPITPSPCLTPNGAARGPLSPYLALLVPTAQARPIFPFTAIVGQEEMKLALILNVIDPKIGGVMIMGDRGTGKSTTIRALADLLPEVPVVDKDPFNSGEQRGLWGSGEGCAVVRGGLWNCR